MRIPAILLLLAAVPGAARGADGAAPGADAGAPPHPLLSSGDEDWMEIRGGFEAGVRAVSGKEGRYEQDVNLDGGFRLLAADIEGTSLEEGLAIDSFSLSLRGLGDPNRLLAGRVSAEGSFDLRFRADRQEYLYRATADPHPWDSTRDTTGASLSLHLARNLVLRLSEDRLRRTGDGEVEMKYRDDQPFPAAATLDYDGRSHSVGLDGTSGPFRFGGTWGWGSAEDDAVRTLQAPSSSPGDTGRYRNESEVSTRDASGRAGWKARGGAVDVSVSGGYHSAETDSRVRGVEAVAGVFVPGTGYDDLKATTEANARGWSGRGEVLLLPHPDWEVLGRYESRSDSVAGSSDAWTRSVLPPGPAAGPYVSDPESTRSDADLGRAGLEARWRASPSWRLRAGAERVRERLVSAQSDRFSTEERVWSPTTWAATAGADWTPNRRFDASVLARGARATGAATALSLDEGSSLSVRLRAKRTDGWHSSLFARVKRRRMDDADASSTYDQYGWSMGNSGEDHFLELAITREDLTTAADTRFVVDASSNPAPTPHRVRYDEAVTAVVLDASQDVGGPFRVFGSLRWADGNGDNPYVQSDIALGAGWRLSPSAELRVEGRRVAYVENDRSVDDYEAEILTVSVACEF